MTDSFFDIGANLTDSMYQGKYNHNSDKLYHEPDLAQVLRRAEAAGVSHIIVTAGQVQETRAALQLISEQKGIIDLFTTVGVHPTRCSTAFLGPDNDADDVLAEMTTLAEHPKVVALGEFGLDYDRLQFCPKDVQQEYFERQFDVLRRCSRPLPLFLHCRGEGAPADMARVLRANRSVWTKAVIHSFDGSKEDADRFLSMDGVFIGLNGCSLRTEASLSVVRDHLPVESLCLETDAPWCGIRPTHPSFALLTADQQAQLKAARDKKKWSPDTAVKGRSEPGHIVQVAQVVASLKQLSLATIAKITTANARKLFI